MLTSGNILANETTTAIPIRKKFIDKKDLNFATIGGENEVASPPPPLILTAFSPSLVRCNNPSLR